MSNDTRIYDDTGRRMTQGDRDRELAIKDASIKMLQDEVRSYQSKLQGCVNQITQLEAQLGGARIDLAERSSRLDSLTKEHELLKANAAYLAEGHKRADEAESRLGTVTSAVQTVMARLADLLDADHFNNIEAIVLEAGVSYPSVVERQERNSGG